MAAHEPNMQSIIDRFGQTDDWLWKSSQFPTLVVHYLCLTVSIATGPSKRKAKHNAAMAMLHKILHLPNEIEIPVSEDTS